LLAVGSLVLGDSAVGSDPALAGRRSALLDAANAALDSALRQQARDVAWVGLAEQRRAMRRAPSLRVDPDRLPTVYLAPRRVESVPEPLWSQLRALAAITGARLAVVPAVVRIEGSAGQLGAMYLLAVADSRTGLVVWRGRVVGSRAASAEAALASAAGAVLTGVAP
jgi:hypothetical protein